MGGKEAVCFSCWLLKQGWVPYTFLVIMIIYRQVLSVFSGLQEQFEKKKLIYSQYLKYQFILHFSFGSHQKLALRRKGDSSALPTLVEVFNQELLYVMVHLPNYSRSGQKIQEVTKGFTRLDMCMFYLHTKDLHPVSGCSVLPPLSKVAENMQSVL